MIYENEATATDEISFGERSLSGSDTAEVIGDGGLVSDAMFGPASTRGVQALAALRNALSQTD